MLNTSTIDRSVIDKHFVHLAYGFERFSVLYKQLLNECSTSRLMILKYVRDACRDPPNVELSFDCGLLHWILSKAGEATASSEEIDICFDIALGTVTSSRSLSLMSSLPAFAVSLEVVAKDMAQNLVRRATALRIVEALLCSGKILTVPVTEIAGELIGQLSSCPWDFQVRILEFLATALNSEHLKASQISRVIAEFSQHWPMKEEVFSAWSKFMVAGCMRHSEIRDEIATLTDGILAQSDSYDFWNLLSALALNRGICKSLLPAVRGEILKNRPISSLRCILQFLIFSFQHSDLRERILLLYPAIMEDVLPVHQSCDEIVCKLALMLSSE